MPAIFNIFCHSSDNLEKENIWFLQAYKFCFADFLKTLNNLEIAAMCFTESQAYSMMRSRVGALQKNYFF